MMFPGNYTWSAATRMVIAAGMWGGADLGEIYKVSAALKPDAGKNAAWFAQWSAMARKVASFGDEAAAKGHKQTAAEEHAACRGCIFCLCERILVNTNAH